MATSRSPAPCTLSDAATSCCDVSRKSSYQNLSARELASYSKHRRDRAKRTVIREVDRAVDPINHPARFVAGLLPTSPHREKECFAHNSIGQRSLDPLLDANPSNSYGGTVVKRLGWGLGDPRVWGARLRGRRAWRVRDARSDSYTRVGTAGPCFVVRARSLRSSVTAWGGCS
jgi:hypothetical protein